VEAENQNGLGKFVEESSLAVINNSGQGSSFSLGNLYTISFWRLGGNTMPRVLLGLSYSCNFSLNILQQSLLEIKLGLDRHVI